MRRLSLWGLLLILTGLNGCSSSPSPLLPPNQLEPMQDRIKVKYMWSRKVGDGVGDRYLKLPPVISENKMYLLDHQGHLWCLSTKDGEPLWERDLAKQVESGPVLEEGYLFAGTSKGEVLAISPVDGNIIWESALSSEILSAPTSQQGIVVARTVDGKVYGLEAKTGKRLWVYERGVPVLTLRGTGRPLIADGVVYAGLDNGHLVALTLREGTVLWDTTIAVPQGRTEIERMVDVDATPMIADGVIYTVAYQGRLSALRADSGRVLWVRDVSSYAGLQMDPYRLYVVDSEGMVIAMDRSSGATLWKQDKLLRRKLTRPQLQMQYLVVADYNGYVHWLSREDGAILARDRVRDNRFGDGTALNDDEHSRANSILATPVVADNMLYAVNRLGVLTAFSVAHP